MSNVIGFLEAVGQDCELRHADGEALASAAARAGIESLAAAMATLLEQRPIVCVSLERHDEPEEEEEPGKEDEEVRAFRAA